MKKHINILMGIVGILAILLFANACTIEINPGHYTSKEIPGAFGYRFGDILDRSMIIEAMISENPRKYEEYLVKPIIENKEFDKYGITICKRTNRIYCIKGFKHFETRDQARNYLVNIRPIIKEKYEENFSKTYKITFDYYEEYIRNASTLISLIILSDKPGWAFMIKYSNELLKNQCPS